MTDEDLIALVQEYFAGVDSQDIDRVLSTVSGLINSHDQGPLESAYGNGEVPTL